MKHYDSNTSIDQSIDGIMFFFDYKFLLVTAVHCSADSIALAI
jgi:hypothetical protein